MTITGRGYTDAVRSKRAAKRKANLWNAVAVVIIIAACALIVYGLTGCSSAPAHASIDCSRVSFAQTSDAPVLFDLLVGGNVVARDLTVNRIRAMCGAQ